MAAVSSILAGTAILAAGAGTYATIREGKKGREQAMAQAEDERRQRNAARQNQAQIEERVAARRARKRPGKRKAGTIGEGGGGLLGGLGDRIGE